MTYRVTELDPGPEWVAGELTCTVTHVDGSTESVAGFEVQVNDQVAARSPTSGPAASSWTR